MRILKNFCIFVKIVIWKKKKQNQNWLKEDWI